MRRRPEAVCTVGLIVVNILVFFILSLFGQTEDAGFMLQHGAMFEPFVTESHEYYRIITSLFLHFGIQQFLLVYFISGIGGNLCSLFWNVSHGEQVISAGASGAIFGLMGALLYIVIVNRGRLGRLSGRGMAVMVVLSLYFGFTSSGVDNPAHVGGLISGIVAAVILYRRKRYDYYDYEPYV